MGQFGSKAQTQPQASNGSPNNTRINVAAAAPAVAANSRNAQNFRNRLPSNAIALNIATPNNSAYGQMGGRRGHKGSRKSGHKGSRKSGHKGSRKSGRGRKGSRSRR